MLTVERREFERVILMIIESNDVRELLREFSKDRLFFYSILKDISCGEDSPNYPLLERIAGAKRISPRYIVEASRMLLSYLAPNEPEEDYYKVLGVHPTSSAVEIRRRWLELLKSLHPDKAGEAGLEATKKLNEAFEVLGNREKKEKYDAVRIPALPVIVRNRATRVLFNAYSPIFAALVLVVALAFIRQFDILSRFREGTRLVAGRSPLSQGELSYCEELGVTGLTPKEFSLEDILATHEESGSCFEQGGVVARAEQEAVTVSGASGSSSVEEDVVQDHSLWGIVRRLGTLVSHTNARDSLSGASLASYPLTVASGEPKIETWQKKAASESIVVKSAPGRGYPSERREAAQSSRVTKGKEARQAALKSRQMVSVPAGVEHLYTPKLHSPDKVSLYSFVDSYRLAYMARDIGRFLALFEPDAVENGVAISRAEVVYRRNFSLYEITHYEIKVRMAELAGNRALVEGDFTLNFRQKGDGRGKTSVGDIKWHLVWSGEGWRIKEINYAIRETSYN